MRKFSQLASGLLGLVIVAAQLALPSHLAAGAVDRSTVVRIIDGDTVEVSDHLETQERVRLAFIDAPERRQAWGERSRQALAELVFGKEVKLERRGRDRYGRTIATLWIGHTNINTEMVRKGYAWVYRQYVPDYRLLLLERSAREARLGLWHDADPTPPWLWRRAPRH